MKVIFLVDTFPKLSETFIAQQITGLIDKGYTVEIVARVRGSNAELQPNIMKYDLLAKVTYLDVPSNPILLAMKLLGYYLNKIGFLLKYPWHSRYHRLVLAVLPFLAEYNFQANDIVICNFGTLGIQASQLKKIGLKFKLITIFHGFDMSSFLLQEPATVYDDVFSSSDYLLSVSNFWKQKLVAMQAPMHKLQILHMGIDVGIYDVPLRLHSGFRILSVGRLVEKKGFAYSLRAFAAVLPELGKGARYVLVGDGPLKTEYESLIHELGIEANVDMVGGKSSNEVLELLRNSDVFIVPSVTAPNGDMEGIPIVMLEAQAAGLPVIATQHGGITEGLNGRLSDYIVPERDSNALSKALVSLYAQPHVRAQLQRAGKQFVTDKFSLSAQTKKLQSYIIMLQQ